MDTCTVETGLLRKAPCGHTAVAKCANCERPLCSKHAIAKMNAGKKTGTFMCAECDAAHRAYEKAAARAPQAVPKTAAPKPPAPRPAAAAPAAKAPVAPPAAAPAKPDEDSLGSIDFTPSKK
jgi:hypothetical protein